MNTQLLDQAKNVRQGEELDTQKVDAWLKQRLTQLTGEPSVTQYAGGASNWTYCLEYPEQSLILRRAPKGTKAKGAHDMAREYKLQQALKPVLAMCQIWRRFATMKTYSAPTFTLWKSLRG
jgi:aminoglycoside phosphotransferase (APT) family kinase protein